MKQGVYDVAVAVVAGLITFGITDALDWLHGWRAWVAAAAVASVTLALIVYIIRRSPRGDRVSGAFNFLHKIRSKGDIEVGDTTVESSGFSADHVSDVKTDGSIKISRSKFSHQVGRSQDRENDA